jgi:kexin
MIREKLLTHCRGENGVGTWTVIVKDTNLNEHNGTFVDWRLNLWGEAIDASIQELHPMPDEHDDDHEVATAIVTTTSISANPGSHSTPPPGNPTGHIDRPTKPRPSDGPSATNDGTPASTSEPDSTTSSAPEATHTYSDSFLPSFFPTFGVSKKTQIWIYGSLGLIVVFCAGLGVYFVVQRRKRLNSTRDGYEFEMVNTDDDDDARRGLKRPRRGGDLYNAFAADSDEELYSDDESERYEDTPSGSSGGSGGSGVGERRVNEKEDGA